MYCQRNGTSQRGTQAVFFHSQLDTYPRDDYRELALLFLGDKSLSNIHIISPELITEQDGWPSSFTGYKFTCFVQFHLIPREFFLTLRQFNMFVVRLCLRAWFNCTSAASAPRNDLQLLKDLIAYLTVNNSVAMVAKKVFLGHVWYLNKCIIDLAFFDNKVSLAEKAEMVKALNKPGLGTY